LFGSVLSLVVEALLLALLVTIVALIAMAIPGGTAWAAGLVQLVDPVLTGDSSGALRVLTYPGVFPALVAVAAIAGPFVEEVLKTLAVGVAGAWLRPEPPRAFLWGVASGAGFAIAEGLLSGALLGDSPWALGAVSRMGATTLHCLASGLVGWGWGQLWTQRRALRFVGSLAAAIVLHGLWNAAAIGAFALGIARSAGEIGSAARIAAGAGAATLIALLGVLAAAMAAGLPLLARQLAAQAQSASDTGDAREIARGAVESSPSDAT
jgi:hypothetical protein